MDHPVRGRFNAAFFSLFDNYIDSMTRDRKLSLFEQLPDRVVEIGPGVGANFRYFRPGTHVTALEPNVHMHGRLANEAKRRALDLDVVARGAENTGLPDQSVDAVVSTLVLCTVPDVADTLGEIRRILKPGGQLIFLEHVAAPRGTWLRRLQDLVKRPWHWCFEGCHTDRDTLTDIRGAGFDHVRADQVVLSSPFVPANVQVSGVAVA